MWEAGCRTAPLKLFTWLGFPHPADVLALPEGAAFAHAASVRARTSRVHHPAALPKGMISRKAVTRLSAIVSRRDRSGAAALPDTRCAPGSRESDAGIMGEVSKAWIKNRKKFGGSLGSSAHRLGRIAWRWACHQSICWKRSSFAGEQSLDCRLGQVLISKGS